MLDSFGLNFFKKQNPIAKIKIIEPVAPSDEGAGFQADKSAWKPEGETAFRVSETEKLALQSV